MFGKTTFIWNSQNSDDLGLQLVTINANVNSDIQIPTRTIISDRTYTKIGSNNYHFGVQRDVLKFKAEFFSETELTQDRIAEIYQLFFLDDYSDLTACDSGHMYHCMATTGSLFIVENKGYFTIDFSCDSEYSNSIWYQEIFDKSAITSPSVIQLNNLGSTSIYCYFELMPKVTGQTIRLTNTTNAGKYIELGTDSNNNELQANETISIDMQKNRLSTDVIDQYRYSNLNPNSDFFEIVRGINNIEISDKCILTVYYRFNYLN